MKNNFLLLILLFCPTISFTDEPITPVENLSFLQQITCSLYKIQAVLMEAVCTQDEGKDAFSSIVIKYIRDNDVDRLKYLFNGLPAEYTSKINDTVNHLGYTCLTYALVYGTPEMVEFFVQRGADINKKDKHGRLPITYLRVNDRFYGEKLSALSKD